MKISLFRVFVGTVIGICLCATGYSQDNKIKAAAGDKYLISAKAGGVNEIDGKVAVSRVDGTSGYLVKGDELNIGDRVSTGDDGKAEVLLNPGSFMRLGSGTSFEFLTTSLDDLRLKLKTGSAIFEVIADDDFRVTILMPRTAMALTRSGVYRIDVLADGSSKVSVWKGKIFLGAKSKTEVKSGRSATVVGINADVQKFDKDERDALTVWSKDRAKELNKINASLQRKAMRNTLLNSFNSRWNLYDSFGVWVFDSTRRVSCFLPFGYGWGSPYGYVYGFDLWNVGLPNRIFSQPPPGFYGAGPATASGGLSSNAPEVGDASSPQMRRPAFLRMENNARMNGDETVNRAPVYQNPDAGSPITTGAAAPAGGVSTPSVAPAARESTREPREMPRGIQRKINPDN